MSKLLDTYKIDTINKLLEVYKPGSNEKQEEIKRLVEVTELFLFEEKRKCYEDARAAETRYYQKKYGFKIDTENNKPGFHNDAGDAFRHTYSSAKFYIQYGEVASTIAGVGHEFGSPNDFDEWNMDSWNNNQGRQIAKEMEEKYGRKTLQQMSQKERDDIIAEKVMKRMRSGQLITSLDDKRVYKGKAEVWARKVSTFGRSPNKSEYINKKISTKANEISETWKRFEREHLETIKKEFEENLKKLDMRNEKPIEKYENLKREDRVFHNGDIPQIAQKASKDITQDEIEDFKVFLKQYERDGKKIPTQAELDERVARGELIWVEGYTKQDGTVVRGYFRHYPETA